MKSFRGRGACLGLFVTYNKTFKINKGVFVFIFVSVKDYFCKLRDIAA
jgi:hypothetical protein